MKERLTQTEKYKQTREDLLAAARELFATKGYHTTSTQDIVDRAGLTRGALYYHFRNKRCLFAAVLEALRAERRTTLLNTINAAEGSLWYRLIEVGCKTFLDSLCNQDARQIIFQDAPMVLPPDVWHGTVSNTAIIEEMLGQLEQEGSMKPTPRKGLARLLCGALLEAGIYVTHADDKKAAREEMLQALLFCLEQLRIPPHQSEHLSVQPATDRDGYEHMDLP